MDFDSTPEIERNSSSPLLPLVCHENIRNRSETTSSTRRSYRAIQTEYACLVFEQRSLCQALLGPHGPPFRAAESRIVGQERSIENVKGHFFDGASRIFFDQKMNDPVIVVGCRHSRSIKSHFDSMKADDAKTVIGIHRFRGRDQFP